MKPLLAAIATLVSLVCSPTLAQSPITVDLPAPSCGLSGCVMSGRINAPQFHVDHNIDYSSGELATKTPLFYKTYTYGATSTMNALAYLGLADQVNYTGPVALDGLAVLLSGGGATFAGNRNAVHARFGIESPANAGDVSFRDYVATFSEAYATVNNGGTGGTVLGNWRAALFGGVDQVRLGTGATYWAGAVGREIDLYVDGASSVAQKVGLWIVQLRGDATPGTFDDLAISIANQGPPAQAGPGWRMGVSFGASQSIWPFPNTATLIGVTPQRMGDPGPSPVAAYGVRLDQVAFTTSAFKSTGFNVDGSGNTVAATLTSNGCAWRAGTGSPNGVIIGSPCDLYTNKSGGKGTTLYVKESGTATKTGWVGK